MSKLFFLLVPFIFIFGIGSNTLFDSTDSMKVTRAEGITETFGIDDTEVTSISFRYYYFVDRNCDFFNGERPEYVADSMNAYYISQMEHIEFKNCENINMEDMFHILSGQGVASVGDSLLVENIVSVLAEEIPLEHLTDTELSRFTNEIVYVMEYTVDVRK